MSNLSALQAKLQAAITAMPGVVHQALESTGQEIVHAMRVTRFTGETTSSSLHSRTGELAASLESRVEGSGNEWKLFVGSGMVYAHMQEHGGTITPVNAKMLAIPLNAAKTGAGVARGGPRDFPNMFLLQRPGKPPLLMQRQGKKTVVPMFVLKSSVTLPEGRLGLRFMMTAMTAGPESLLATKLRRHLREDVLGGG